MSIRADLHVHSKVSKALPFRMDCFNRMVSWARQVGLDGLALTEHFHSTDFWHAMDRLTRKYPYADGQLKVAPGFSVLTGAEVTLADEADVTVIGPLECLAWLDKQFLPTLSSGFFPRLVDLIEPAHAAGLILIGAHPTRPRKVLADLAEEHLRLLDALEVSGKDMATGPANEFVERFASDLDLPVIGGSDAHYWPQVGVEYTVFPCQELTFDALRVSLSRKETCARTSPNVTKMVRLCTAYKRRFKAKLLQRNQSLPETLVRPSAIHVQLGLVPSSVTPASSFREDPREVLSNDTAVVAGALR